MPHTGVRPCAGHHFLRRRKNCILVFAVVIIMTCTVLQMLEDGVTYTPLRPLSGAKDEARRLLKFITHYNYACNATVHAFNHTQWQICVDHKVGLDLEEKDSNKIVYSVRPEDDYSIERMLALNFSYNVFIISDRITRPLLQFSNNTYVIVTTITANDPADFSRNSYGQRTVNDVMKSLHHDRLDLLRIEGSGSTMWEVLHHMINDNLLMHVKQLHVTMRIDKLDEDYLYSWYRVVYGLFYKQGLWLYHTASSDSLCLQVTMMESCVYYLSFVRNPGSHVFVLHPPADYGTMEMEESRLLTHISSPTVVCKQAVIGGDADQNMPTTSPQWQVCSHKHYELFQKPCVILRYRMQSDAVLDQKFVQEGCSVHTLVLSDTRRTSGGEPTELMYRIHSQLPHNSKTSRTLGNKALLSSGDTFRMLAELGDINMIEIDVSQGKQWPVITSLLDSGLLSNVSQVVARVVLPDVARGLHPTVLRSCYSELRRMEAQGFEIFYSGAEDSVAGQERLGENCCFQMGFLRKVDTMR